MWPALRQLGADKRQSLAFIVGPKTPLRSRPQSAACILLLPEKDGRQDHRCDPPQTAAPQERGRSPENFTGITCTTIMQAADWVLGFANSTPPLSVTDSAIAPSAKMPDCWVGNLIVAKDTNSDVIKTRYWSASPPAARLTVQLLTRPCFFLCLFLLLLGRSPWAEALLAVGVFTRCCHTCRPPESSKFRGLQGPVSSRGRSPQKFGIIPQ